MAAFIDLNQEARKVPNTLFNDAERSFTAIRKDLYEWHFEASLIPESHDLPWGSNNVTFEAQFWARKLWLQKSRSSGNNVAENV